jgi:hypothetical protein
MTDESRIDAVKSAVEAAAASDSALKVKVPEFREGRDGPWPLITIHVDKVIYNPRSHRVIAQLEGHPLEELVKKDPFCDDAQKAIEQILRATDHYERLRDDLDSRGQQQHGIITHAGMLVNANTRLAALRELNVNFIEVAVLPKDADDNDILELETALQVQEDFKQEYDFANQLLLIESYRTRRYDLESTAKALNEDVAYVETHLRWLAMIREIQALHGGDQLPITFFNDKRQAITDLDDDIEKARKQGDLNRVESVREAGYLGLVLGMKYRKMRYFTHVGVVEDRWLPLISDGPAFGAAVAGMIQPEDSGGAANSDDDSDLLGADDDEAPIAGLGALTTLIASNYGRNTVSVPGPNGSRLTVGRDDLVGHLVETAEEAADEEKLETQNDKKAGSAVDRLKEARKKAQAAIKSHPVAIKEPGFDQGKFDCAVRDLRREVEKLEVLTTKGMDKSTKKRK